MIVYILAAFLFLSIIAILIILFYKKSKIDELKYFKSDAQKKIESLNGIIVELKNSQQNYIEELKKLNEENSRIKVEKSALIQKVELYEKQISELQNKNENILKENLRKADRNLELEKELSEIKEKAQRFGERIERLNNEKRKLEEESKKVSERLIVLEKENSELSEKTQLYIKTIAKLEEEKNKISEENRNLLEKMMILEKELSEVKTTIKEEKKNTQEKLELLQKARDELSEAFENLSNKILDQRLDKLEKTNFTGLKTVLEPLKIQIKDFKEKLENIGSQQIKEQGKLLNELQNLKDLNKKLSEEASNLTKALKGDKKLQGNWGEIRLKRIFENSGLQEGIEYELQKSVSDKDGKRFIPDAVVHLPNERDIIIDSKVSLVSYEKYFTTDNEMAKDKFLKEFLTAIKTHIKQLSEKSYDKLAGINTLDYVLMFIPIEAAYLTAIQKSADIFDFAVKNGIMLVSPSTLLLALKTVNNLWKIEHQNRNIKEIVKRGEMMYDKFVTFIDELKDVGKHLDMAKRSYDNSYKLLTTGRGNLVFQAEKLRKLGINPKKNLKNIEFFED